MRRVLLKIRGEQRYEGQSPDRIELMTMGTFGPKEDGWAISYQESELTGLAGTTTVFEIHPNRICLNRSGTVQSQMIFEQGVCHNSLYQLEEGALMIRVCARQIQSDLTEAGGTLEIADRIEIEGSAVGMVRYHIEVQPMP